MSDVGTLVRRRVQESLRATEGLLSEDSVSFVVQCAELLVDALRAGGTALFCGNGGSAVDATHLAGELVGRFRLERAPLAALSLTDNVSALSAIANDYSYAETFARQVRGLGRPGDVLVALSTSGASANVLAAIDAAREREMHTVGMTGADGGQLARVADLCLRASSSETARVQEVHMVAGHTVCELVERAFATAP